MTHSLVLLTYAEDEVDDASEMRDVLRSRLPDMLFTLVPRSAAGRDLTYALVAGPAYDAGDAEDLRRRLAEVMTREDPATWAVEATPRAFFLEEEATLTEAQTSLASLTGRDIPAYVLQVTYPDGSGAYHILSGAYEGPEDARPLQRVLRDAGYEDAPLIERRGSLPE
jgi:hypothetical protein